MMSPGMEVSLFDCLSDVGGCLMACCCGCIVSGFSAARLDNRECTIFDIFTNDYQVRFGEATIQSKMEEKENLWGRGKEKGREEGIGGGSMQEKMRFALVGFRLFDC